MNATLLCSALRSETPSAPRFRLPTLPPAPCELGDKGREKKKCPWLESPTHSRTTSSTARRLGPGEDFTLPPCSRPSPSPAGVLKACVSAISHTGERTLQAFKDTEL
ncbi:hypothetical protein NDU88_007750 [Pleurodeles waltl]|uniref:Uncharacterized protein n=1 Tax=Pleurodeles waltl TaxID=8319 RepID=A0AAV7VTA3_PLEWA|nr:hypothetical protein NDU88_007750 [Pleurodeles waltl]